MIGSYVTAIADRALSTFIYMGLDPPNYAPLVFYECPSLETVLVSVDYSDEYFCGMKTTKTEIITAYTPPAAETASADGSSWFVENIVWIAPTFTVFATALGLLLKYDDLKKFFYEHCSKREVDTTSLVSTCEPQYTTRQDLI